MPWACAMPHIAAGSTAPPRCTWSSVSSSPRGCGALGALFSCRWAAHAAPAAGPRGLPLGVLVPDRVPIVIGRADLEEPVPDLGAAQLLLGARLIDRALEHHVAVVRRADEAPAVLGQQVDEPRDLGEPLRRVGDELAEPAGVAALAAVGAVKLVADGPEDVDEDVRRTRHRHDVTRALRRSGSPHRNPWRSRRARRS